MKLVYIKEGTHINPEAVVRVFEDEFKDCYIELHDSIVRSSYGISETIMKLSGEAVWRTSTEFAG